jgi:hypothetical protein
MYMLGHQNKRMQLISALAPMPVERLQENPDVRFDNEQSLALPRGERHEISSRRRDESSGLQGETSAAGSRTSSLTLNWHEWNSCPSRLFSECGVQFWERVSCPDRICFGIGAVQVLRMTKLRAKG